MAKDYWAPFATKSPVALRDSQKNTIRPVGLVLHTAVSNSSNLRPSGTTRWHFYCNKEGKLYQYFAVNHMAAAQLDGNEWSAGGEMRGFVSVETWDGAGTSVWPNYNSAPDSGPSWNAAQVASLAKLAAWLHTEHGVPLVKATGARGTGIGYHRQFQNTSPYEWTSSHACPGSRRIAQVPGIISRAKTLASAGSEYVAYPGAAHFKLGNKSDTIGRMNTRLRHKDLGAPDSREFTAASKKAYAAWQRELGYTGADADGIPGETSWDRLRVKKTTVVAGLPKPAPAPVPVPEIPPAPVPAPVPADPAAELETPMRPAQLVQVDGEPAVYAVGLRVVHIVSPVHLSLLREQGWVSGGIRKVSKAELSALLKKPLV